MLPLNDFFIFWTSQKNAAFQEAMLAFRNCHLLCYNLNGLLCFYDSINIRIAAVR